MTKKIKPYIYLFPGVFLIFFWMIIPLGKSFYYAFVSWGMLPGTLPTYVGMENFRKLINTNDFIISIKNTIFYTIGMIPFTVIFPILLATVTENMSDLPKKIYRVIFFIPMLLAPVATATIWRWLLHPTNGIVTQTMNSLGMETTSASVFSNPTFAKYIILFITGWKMFGYCTMMFSASIANLNKDYIAAAKLDGASNTRVFFTIIVPLLSPTIMMMLMLTMLFASQMTFAFIDSLTQGGPYGNSTNIYYEMYKYGFSNFDVGLSSAAGLMFFIVFSVIAFLLNLLSEKISFFDNK